MHNQKGSALVLVMLTVAALLIVGVSLVAASTVEYRSSVNHGHSTQAFFVAEAGLNWARRGLPTDPNLRSVLPTSVGQETVLYRNAAFGTPAVGHPVAPLDAVGPVEVRVRRLTLTTLQIESRGRQHQALRTVSMLITETGGAGSGSLPTSHHVRTNFHPHGNPTINGDPVVGQLNFNYPDVIIPRPPDHLITRGVLTVTGEHTIMRPEDFAHYGSVTVNGTLTINPGDVNRLIRMQDLIVNRGASVVIGGGTGTVAVHVNNTINIQGTVGSTTTVNRLQVIQHSSNSVEIGSDGGNAPHAAFHGTLVTNNANIRIDKNTTVSGLLLTNSSENDAIRIRNEARIGTATQGVLLYAPRGEVDIDNGAHVHGVVVVNILRAGNKVELTLNRTGVPSSAPFVTFGGGGPTFSFSNWNTQP